MIKSAKAAVSRQKEMARRFFYALFYSEYTVSGPEASRQRAGCLYSLECREGVFSETGLPVSLILGSWLFLSLRRPVFLRPVTLAALLRVVFAPSFSKLLASALRLNTSVVVFLPHDPIMLSVSVPRSPITLSVSAVSHLAYPSSFIASRSRARPLSRTSLSPARFSRTWRIRAAISPQVKAKSRTSPVAGLTPRLASSRYRGLPLTWVRPSNLVPSSFGTHALIH